MNPLRVLADHRLPGSKSVPLWRIARRVSEPGFPHLPLLSVYRDWGVVPREGRKDNYNKPSEDLASYQRVSPGDLVLNKMKTWQGSLGVSSHLGIVSPAYFVCRLDQDAVYGRYVHYLLRSAPYIAAFGALSKGIRPQQWDLPWEHLRTLPVPLPRVEVQRRIADFLDDQVALLDRAVELRQQQAALAREVASAGIDDLVRGARAPELVEADYTPLRGVPSHWGQGRLRSVRCQVQTGPFGSQLHAYEYVEGGWPVVNPLNLQGDGIVADPGMTVSDVTRARLARHVLREGDIVFGRRGELGRSALVGSGQAGWLCGTGSLRVRFTGASFHPAYLSRYLRLPAIRFYFKSASVGSTMDNLNTSILLGMPLLLPPLPEQRAVAEACDSLASRAAQTDTLLTHSLALLAERRQALITAAVTGEFDVTTARSVA